MFPETLIFNEGWLLRLILEWYSKNQIVDSPINFYSGACWFSEARLPSPFLARFRRDKLAEAHTHLDGVIGHFIIGGKGKTELSLKNNAQQFIALEAKIFSKLSSTITNKNNYNQATRNIACIAEVLKRANQPPQGLKEVSFYVIAPESQISKDVFTNHLSRSIILEQIQNRINDYEGAKDKWYKEWFLPLFEIIKINAISWENTIQEINNQDKEFGFLIYSFYRKCLQYNTRS